MVLSFSKRGVLFAAVAVVGLALALVSLPQSGPDTASADGTGFRMNFRVKAPPGVCDDIDNPTTCTMPVGTKFALSVEVIDPPTPYQGVQTDILYGSLIYQPTALAIDEVVWPDVLGFARSPGSPTGTEGNVVNFANTSSQAPYVPSYYVGAVMQISLRCTTSTSSTVVKLATSLEIPGSSSSIGVISGPSVVVETPKTVATGTADTLTINCLSALPTYTPGSPTATPTASATPIPPDQPAGMDLTVKSGGVCDVVDKPVACSVLIGGSISLAIVTNDRPAGGYDGVQTFVQLDGLAYKPTPLAVDEFPWPDCAQPLRSYSPTEDRVVHGCSTAAGPPRPVSTYSGNVVQFKLTCPAGAGTHVLQLRPYSMANPLGSGYKRTGDAAISVPPDSLTINCVAVLPTPTPGPPTPASVGGVSFAPPGDGGANGSAIDTAALLVLTTGVFALTAAAWYARRRVHR